MGSQWFTNIPFFIKNAQIVVYLAIINLVIGTIFVNQGDQDCQFRTTKSKMKAEILGMPLNFWKLAAASGSSSFQVMVSNTIQWK